MKNYTIIFVILILTFLATYAFAEQAYAPGRLLVKFRRTSKEASQFHINTARGTAQTGLASVDQLNSQYNVSHIKRAFIEIQDKQLAHELGTDCWYMLTLPETYDMTVVANQYKMDKHIVEASPDWRMYPTVVPNDPNYSYQWGHNNTGQMLSYDSGSGQHDGAPVGTVGFDGNMETAWDELSGYGSSSIIIGIIDSGVDLDHPDLVNNLVAGYDFGDNDTNPDDNSSDPGHGTGCAGIAAAEANNGIGVAGVAGGCKIMPLKVANSDGIIYFSTVTNAIYYGADNGAHILSISLGDSRYASCVPAMDEAIEYAYNSNDVTILAAAGNENDDFMLYPACNNFVIGVAAASPCGERKSLTTCDGEDWWGSTYGANSQDAADAVDIIAPTILPTTSVGGGYELYFNGTSSSTPFAAGVCALLKSQNATWTPAQIRLQLTATAEDVVSAESGAGWDQFTGYGMIDAYAALTTPPPGGNPPVFTATGPFTINEFAVEGSTVGDINANNGDGGGDDVGINYTVITNWNDDGDGFNAFAINMASGVITVNDAGDLDADNSPITITVQADEGFYQTTADVTINLTPLGATIHYVDGDASGENNGTSWTNAFTDLHAALAAAVYGDSIFVKYGTYKTTTTTNREIYFVIPSGVAVMGHFAGTETNSSQRDTSNPTYETILSADIGTIGDGSDNSYHVTTISNGSSTTILDHLTITGGRAKFDDPYNSDPRQCGGGIYIMGGSPTIRSCEISGNWGSFGAGIFMEGTNPIITQCLISNNNALVGGGRGAGIYNSEGNPQITNCTFTQNSAATGGAIENTGAFSSGAGHAVITGCTFHQNSAYDGGAIRNSDCSATITNCTITENWADVQGSGIYNTSVYGNLNHTVITDCIFQENWINDTSHYDRNHGTISNVTAAPTISNCTFTGNSGFTSGIISVNSSPTITNCKFMGNTIGPVIRNNNCSNVVITNCAITGNSSEQNGGGIANYSTNPAITNCTISANKTDANGGGIYNKNSNPDIRNTIIWLNDALLDGDEVYNPNSSPTFSYSDVKGSGGSGGWDGSLGIDGGNNIDLSPVFVEQKHPSTAPTTAGDYHLRLNSNAINTGNNDYVTEFYDLDGEDRIQDGTVDMGAYEGGEPSDVIYVKYDAPGLNNGTSWTNAYTELQDALDEAIAGDEIYVAGGTYYPDRNTDNRDSSFVISSGVKIYGHFAGSEGSHFDRDFNTPAYETILSGDIGITANNSDNSYHVVTFNNADSTTIFDGITISHGNANGSGSNNSGGGIYAVQSSPFIQNCIISGNSAVYGGGIANSDNASPTLINCIVMGNLADYGAAISNSVSSSPEMINCTISGNNGTIDGGAVYNVDSSPVFKNTILWGNNTTVDMISNVGSSTPTYAYSDIETSGGSAAWDSIFGTDNGSNKDVDPFFLADAPDYTLAPTTEGNVYFYGRSPCKNTGNNAFVPSDIQYDLTGRDRIQGRVDMGVYEGELDQNYIFYVKWDAAGANNGTSWSDAFTDFQDALIRATLDDTIYVARGTYKPTTTTDRDISFKVFPGMAVFGHFAGTESNPNERQLSNPAYKTILSGDIDNNGILDTGNTRHVVYFYWNNSSTIFDGFTITGGYAYDNYDYGGGILCRNSSTTIMRNCIITGNKGYYGGGMSINSQSNPTIINCIFTDNNAHLGGAIFSGDNYTSDRSAYSLINSVTYGNSGNWENSALCDMMSDAWGFHPKIKNSIISGRLYQIYDGNFEVYNSNLLTGGSYIDGGGNLNIDPQFVDAPNGDFHLSDASPCIDTGKNSYVPAYIQFDLDGEDRIQYATVDMGAYENSTPRIVVLTSPITNITKTTATGGGNVTQEGASSVTAKGVCWNTTGTPTLSDNFTTDGSGSGSFTSNLTGLTASTLYYVRAYATNSDTTAYGEEITFNTAMDPPGYALDFDGTDDYVSIPDSPGISIIGNITVEAWLNRAASGTDQGIVEKWGWSDGGYNLRIQADGKATFATIDNATNFDNVTSNTTIGTNQWYHLAGVWDASTLRIYVNGVLDNSVASTRNPKDGAAPLIIGARGLADTSFFDGEMDEVRIWNVARTQQQIQDNMNQIIDAATSGLVAYYRFDELGGTTLPDLTANGNDGTLNNMDDSDWIQSIAPFGETGAYVDNTTPTSVGEIGKQMEVTITSTPDASNFLEIYTTGDGNGGVDDEVFPGGVTCRTDILWGVAELGSVTADLVFDYSNVSTIANPAAVKLLKRTDPTQPWQDITTDPNFSRDDGSRTMSLTNQTEFCEFSLSNPDILIITTSPVTDITQTTATGGGNVTQEGASSVTAKGVCWNTAGTPTISDNLTTDGSGLGSFNSSLTGLTASTRYYVRAYATNSEGTSYGEEVTFITPLEPPGNALDFDGSDDYVGISTGTTTLSGTFTVEAWAKPNHATARIAIMGSRSPSDCSFDVKFKDGNLIHGDIGDGSSWLSTAADATFSYAVGQWYHIAYVVTSTGYTIYIDGVQRGSGSYSGNPLLLDANHQLKLGNSGSGESYNGQIDEVRIWNVARTQQEIQDNMNQVIDPSISGLVAYYRFDHLTGTTLGDLTANGNHGTLTNMTDADWIQSLAPLGDNGAYVNTTTPTPVGDAGQQMEVTITSTPDASNFLEIYATGSGDSVVTNETFPSGVTRRPNIFWGVAELGSVTADLVFDYSNITNISDPANIILMKRSDPTQPWTDITGDPGFSRDDVAMTMTLTNQTDFCEFSLGNTEGFFTFVYDGTDYEDNSTIEAEKYENIELQFDLTAKSGYSDASFTWSVSQSTDCTVEISGNRGTSGTPSPSRKISTSRSVKQTYSQKSSREKSKQSQSRKSPSKEFLENDFKGERGTRAIVTDTRTITVNTPTDFVGTSSFTITVNDGHADHVINFDITTVLPIYPPGNALDFDGSDDYVEFPDTDELSITGDMTISAWINVDDFDDYRSIMAKCLGNIPAPYDFYLSISSGIPIFYRGNGTVHGNVSATNPPLLGQWQHIAVTMSGTTVTHYLNGELNGSGTLSTTIADGNGPLILGSRTDFATKMKGQMDEVRIWNAARTQQEIQDNMNQNINPATSGLVAYYRCDVFEGTTVPDLTTNDYDGTLNNMDDSDWIQSLAPLGDNGAYVNTTTPTPVGNAGLQMQVTITSTPDASNYLGIYATGDGNGEVTGETFPGGVSRRFNIFWGVEEFGSVTANLVFDYSGISGITNPAAVRLLKRNDATSDWVDVTGDFIHDTVARTFTGTGFTEFSEFSPGDGGENPLPVELQDFYAEVIPGGIQLHWSTASEVNNAGFKIYRKAGDLPGFQNLEGLIQGAGTTSEPQEYSFVDKNVQADVLYTYQIADVEEGTNKETLHPPITIMATKDALQSKEIPKAFALHANYPNPFNPTTTIEFDVPDLTGFKNLFDLTLKIYDASGKLVKTLIDEPMEPGYHSVVWDGKDDNGRAVSSGVYYCKMVTEKYSDVMQLVLLK